MVKTKPTKWIVLACTFLLLGGIGWFFFRPSEPEHPSAPEQRPEVFEIEGSTDNRITKAMQILTKYCTPPGPLINVHMAEDLFDNSGGWVPGPSDSHIYGVLTVPASDLQKWKDLLVRGSVNNRGTELRPARIPVWWPSEQLLADAELFHAQPLIGRTVGWAAVSSSTSSITFYAFNP